MQAQGFTEQTLVYLAAAVIAVPIAKRLGLGSVLGFLLAGVAIGPSGLGLISDVETILHFAEFGVVLLLFLVGLELNPRKLMEMRWPIFGAGSVQVFATIAAVVGLALALGAHTSTALVAGMGIAMSSTAIALATLEERRLLATDGGRIGFAVLLFQDLAVIPLTLTLALITPGEHTDFDISTALKAIAAIAIVVIGGRFLLRPLLRYIAKTGLREIFIAFSLLLVVGIATVMQSVGLSMALGTFLAGVLLADSEYRHELELDIEPFKGLLLGLFFIAVGMSIDLGTIMRAPLLVIGLVLGAVALKFALLYPLARRFGTTREGAILFGISLSSVGEFAFVIFAAAAAQRILPRETIDLLNVTVAGSMLTTPILFLLYDRVLAPRMAADGARPADRIEERNPVIVAGFGRFGQVVTRVLRGMECDVTIIDHDPNQIEMTRRFGWKAYYGDATRLDLLESAGLAGTKLLIVAIDDPDAVLRIVRQVRERYPNVQVLARARGRSDAFELSVMNVPFVRETFRSAVEAAEAALKLLGHSALRARRLTEQFRRHDEAQIPIAAAHRHDIKKLIALSDQGREDLAQLLATESRSEAEQALDRGQRTSAQASARDKASS